ncbi:hypothetical protein ALQ64_100923 [Pseudomonas cannabina]|uniref:Uncharacterized protein n=1 Tax=Pseudomonas cannabina TaxID=86840 RepID=A0A0P9L9U3_PSECA|nr:Unknown protein sequence [Pseudomonas syringae pv. maculicola]KPW24325.1 hypothetical protein ALO83_101536 [Pseudomonas cannabina pv. alisalensis]KPW66754.1 hypothetical protein ALO81_100852 [Pseudomonas cannabina]RMN33001.1 hypothetical protein ALQ64_100923 [Pseudomonas cannabina]RMN79284.1 hypothetical protein ALQ53_101469 [Pseudomonas cannabina]
MPGCGTTFDAFLAGAGHCWRLFDGSRILRSESMFRADLPNLSYAFSEFAECFLGGCARVR